MKIHTFIPYQNSRAWLTACLLLGILVQGCNDEETLAPCVSDFSYPEPAYTQDEPVNPVPVYEGEGEDVPGVFSSDDDLVFADETTGEVDLTASRPGTYNVRKLMIGNPGCGNRITIAQITIRPPDQLGEPVFLRFPEIGHFITLLDDQRIGATEESVQDQGLLEQISLDNGVFAFRSVSNDQILRIDPDNSFYLVADGGDEADLDWEKFYIEETPVGSGGYAIKCVANDMYLNVENIPEYPLRAIAGGINTWEVFEIYEQDHE